MKIVVVGAGTAGLISAIQIKSLLPGTDIQVITSENVPIIGVGEGSTEHWTQFLNNADIDRAEMVAECKATYKFGIRFMGWREKPFNDYFHSVGHPGLIDGTFNGVYAIAAANNRQLTPITNNVKFRDGLVVDGDFNHEQTNQFHFDTFALNEYLVKVAQRKGIDFNKRDVLGIERDPESGNITALVTDSGLVETDFVIDATGFRRVVHSLLGESRWKSFSEWLLCDSAIAYQTPAREDGKILPYTIAHALSSGWRFEIPTQERRGNGYVFSSQHLSVDQAADELIAATGHKNAKEFRQFRFDPGYLEEPWVFNCCAVGLSSSFVEPLEATSIASSIQQALALASYVPNIDKAGDSARRVYNKAMASMMENILVMIAMHYISDRRDSEMWRDAAELPLPDLLADFIDVIRLRGPEDGDLPFHGFELFRSAHFWHVAQGQGLIEPNNLKPILIAKQNRGNFGKVLLENRNRRSGARLIDHKESLIRWR